MRSYSAFIRLPKYPGLFCKQKAEILDRFQSLIRINTSSRRGNQTKAIEYLRQALEAEGIL